MNEEFRWDFIKETHGGRNSTIQGEGIRDVGSGFVNIPEDEPSSVKKAELDNEKSRYSSDVVGKEKARIKGRLTTLKKNARERIESILNLRTLIVIGLVTLFLGLYIYNVTSINRLGEEVRQKKELYEQLFSLVLEKKSKLEYLQRSENISAKASQKLGLRFRSQIPIILKER